MKNSEEKEDEDVVIAFEKSNSVLPIEEQETEINPLHKTAISIIVAMVFYTLGIYFGSYLGGRLHP